MYEWGVDKRKNILFFGISSFLKFIFAFFLKNQ